MWLAPRTTYRFAALHYVTPVSYHPALKSPQALDFAADAVLRALPTTEGAGRRIFVPRSRTATRGLANAGAIEAMLARLGFATIDVEALDFAAQVQAFRTADCVVGVMGAAMTSTLFCAAQTRVVHLAPQGWTEPFFRDLAAVRGHAYAACFGAGDPALPPEIRPFAIDPALLRGVLDEITVPA
jgi:capsular polysaccharide biosynthesis protein